MGLALVVLVPWTVRNAFTFHAFVPVSTNLGDTLCLDNSAGAYGGFRDLPPECSSGGGTDSPAGGEPARNSHNLHYAVPLGGPSSGSTSCGSSFAPRVLRLSQRSRRR